MQSNIQNRLLSGLSRLAGLTICLTGRDSMVFNGVLVDRKKQQLTITNRKHGMDAMDLQKFIPKGCPVLVNIEGWGVLVKKASFDNDGNIIGNLVPNADDFELFCFRQGQQGYVAIIRREVFGEILLLLKQFPFELAGISAGPFAVSSIIELLGQEEHIIAGNWSLQVKDEIIVDIKTQSVVEPFNYKLGNDIISSDYLTAFALVAQFFAGSYGEEGFNYEFRKELAYKQLSFWVGGTVLGLLFLALLGNYFFFEQLSDKYNSINTEYAMHESVLKQLKRAEEQVKQTEELIVEGGLTGTSSLAGFADKLAMSLPSGMVLTRMEMFPLQGKIMQGKEIIFKENTIKIEGETYETLLIHQWISTLKKESWIKEVQLESFIKDDDNSPAVFYIAISF